MIGSKRFALLLCIVISLFSGQKCSAQIIRSGPAVLRVPVAGGELKEAFDRVKRLFSEGRLEEGYSGYRRLFLEGRDKLFQVSKDHFVSGDIFIRSLLLSLTSRQKKGCASSIKELALKCEAAWKNDGNIEAGKILRRELLVTAPGRSALALHAEELFERGAFGGAEDLWRLLISLSEGGTEKLWKSLGMASLLEGDENGFKEALGMIKRMDNSGLFVDELKKYKLDYDSGLKNSRGIKSGRVSVFDLQSMQLQETCFHEGIKAWRTVGGIWPYYNQVTGEPSDLEISNYAVPFKGSVYATSGITMISEFDLGSGKLLHRFGYDPAHFLGQLKESVERNPRTLVVSDRYVIGSFIVRIKDPASYHYYPIKEPIPYRSVFVFSRRGRKLLWRSDQIAGLEKESVVGLPLLRGDTLYIPGWIQEGYVNIYVTAVNVNTGKVLWRRVVCGSQVEGTMFGEMAVEPFGVTLASSRELLFVATNMGAVAALRRSDGIIRWLKKYKSKDIFMGRGIYQLFRHTSWYDNPILVHNSRIFVAPRDCPRGFAMILSLDMNSGKLFRLWKVPEETTRLRYLLGIKNEIIYMAGDMGISLLSLKDYRKQTVWRLNNNYEILIGRPALVRDGIYFCTLSARSDVSSRTGIYFYDFDSGTCMSVTDSRNRRKTVMSENIINRRELGNIFVSDDVVLISSRRYVTTYVPVEKDAP